MNLNRMTTTPLAFPRTKRRHGVKVLTSLPAGRVVPMMAVPLLREDGCSGRVRLTFEMQETAELLMNAVYVDVKAYLVPWLAFERFGGSMDIFNRSYNGLPPFEGEEVIPFFETAEMGAHGSKDLYEYLGLHANATTNVNTMYAEAYNAIWNFRAQARSKDITPRSRLDYTLAPAFWRHENFAHVVPDFDQAVLDGEVALNIVAQHLAVKGPDGSAKAVVSGIGISNVNDILNNGPFTVRESSGTTATYTKGKSFNDGHSVMYMRGTDDQDYPDIYADLTDVVAEMADNGITISLSNIELARKMQAFARIREKYAEHSEDWIIDMLMGGMSIPDQALKQPILLAQRANVFGQSKRYSTDADALDVSAVNGMSMVDLAIRVPRLATGGIIMITAEVTPEQLFERKKDVFFHTSTVESLPEALRDTLDPEKVDVVTNDYVDVAHSTPNGTFGYEPMNAKWNEVRYNIGGKFYRPSVDAAEDEARQRLWAVEAEDPVLSEDFFICKTIHQKPFLDTVADPFEAVAVAEFMIDGNTQFGGVLVEAMANYEAVKEKAPVERTEKD